MDKTKHIKIEYCSVSYPVGMNMPNLMALVDVYVDAFHKYITLPEETNINIWCRGSSGAIIAAIFASKVTSVPKHLITISHVKKDGEFAHGSTHYNDSKPYNIVIDDFVSSGGTVDAILKYINKRTGLESVDLLIVAFGALNKFNKKKFFKTIISHD